MAAGESFVLGTLLEVLVIIVAAKIGGEIAERFKQSSVLGELIMGVVVGYFALVHSPAILRDIAEVKLGGTITGWRPEYLNASVLTVLAELGVIILLFEVGLESDIKELVKVGPSAIWVGLIGIVASFLTGMTASWMLGHFGIWADDLLFHVFVGATLTATSVGITARVFADMGRLNTSEARIILGAAVFDDIGGLLILAIVAALAAGDALSAGQIAVIVFKAVGFLVVSVGIGILFIPKAVDRLTARLTTRGSTLAVAFVFMLLMSYLAGVAGLAPIVGAFAGGLILAQSRSAHLIFTEIRPMAVILVPFFFVMLGVQVDLTEMGGRVGAVVAIGLLLTSVAILGKIVSGLGVVSGASRYVVGVGMSPRGEVGLIFAIMGLNAGLIETWEYTALIIVVMLTTFVTPIWLARLGDRMHAGGMPTEMQKEAAEITRA